MVESLERLGGSFQMIQLAVNLTVRVGPVRRVVVDEIDRSRDACPAGQVRLGVQPAGVRIREFAAQRSVHEEIIGHLAYSNA
jgi:hypothetical protein